MQCAAAAMAAGGTVTGMRAWLAAYRPAWLTAHRLKVVSALLLATGVIGAGAIAVPPSQPSQDQASPAGR